MPRRGGTALRSFLLLGALLAGGAVPALGQAVRQNAGFRAATLSPNDDGSTFLVPIGFPVNFFGVTYSDLYVNNNGNVTFGGPLFDYTPTGLAGSSLRIIAPFWADVDTRGDGSSPVTYGQDTVDGRRAFGVNYINVGYYSLHTDKLNSFQVVLIDRSDTGSGNFDIEFNYDRIVWESGDIEGSNGFGGTSAAAGYSNGAGFSFELEGSLQPGSFLDSNPNGLIHRTLNSTVPGRLVFQVRGGSVGCAVSISPSSQSFSAAGGTGTIAVSAPENCSWSAVSNSGFITISGGASGTGNGTVSYAVASNPASTSRTGSISIQGRTFTVSQSGTGGGGEIPGSVVPVLSRLDFFGTSGSGVASRAVDLTSNSPASFTATAVELNGPDWLSVSPSSGSTAARGFLPQENLEAAVSAGRLIVFVSFSDLAPGFYEGDIEVGAGGGVRRIHVTATVAPNQPRLLVSPEAVVMVASENGLPPLPQKVRIANLGPVGMGWAVSGGEPAAGWLGVSPGAGTAVGGGWSEVTLTANPAGLAAGLYQ
ncbi:MAG TPA: nidogen-like domain-containing protein, partial [Terriglobia bacterium]|nr:nidogen-like domain-containing protein [Terriglobia bacterium]